MELKSSSNKTLFFYFCLLLAGLYAVSKCLFIPVFPVSTDPGAFSAIALHIKHGKLLYVDVFDSKPPGIFILNEIALYFSESIISIKWLSVFFAFINGLVAFAIFKKLTKNSIVSVGGTLVYTSLYYSQFIYGTGNFTEEFATVFLLSGFAVFLYNEEKQNNVIYLISGMVAGFSIWIKEPYFLPLIVITGYQIYLLWNKGKRPKLFLIGGYFLISAFMIFQLGIKGNFGGFLNYLEYNIAYSKFESSHLSVFEKIKENIVHFYTISYYDQPNRVLYLMSLIAGVIYSFIPSQNRRYQYLPLMVTLWFVADLIAASFSNFKFAHYYLQPLFSMTLCAGFGMLGFYHFLKYIFRNVFLVHLHRTTDGIAALTIILFLYNHTNKPTFLDISFNKPAYIENSIVNKIKAVPGSNIKLFVENPELCSYYVRTGMISNVKFPDASHFFFRIATAEGTGRDKAIAMLNQLRTDPPEFIITKNKFTEFTYAADADEWYHENYSVADSVISKSGNEYLWQHK
ncbi:MAG: glycosyltransferase family 39 protein [Bacteroidia bacterium]|nr:glycosyltransferase family 39 protein [Bacteroidia bacterium]